MHRAPSFFASIRVGHDACWCWAGEVDVAGRGILVGGESAAYYAWTITFGPIAGSAVVLPSCGTPNCVNPTHLRRTESENTRFWSKVERGGPDDCWLWTGARGANGGGVFFFDGKLVPAQRVAWELFHGQAVPLAPEYGQRRRRHASVFHADRCRTPNCVNPAHLQLERPKNRLWAVELVPDAEGMGEAVSTPRRAVLTPAPATPAERTWVYSRHAPHLQRPDDALRGQWEWIPEEDAGTTPPSDDDVARFWSSVKRYGPDDCWPWLGDKGGFLYEGNRAAPLRFAWELKNGVVKVRRAEQPGDHEIPCVFHTCGRSDCANPKHGHGGLNTDRRKTLSIAAPPLPKDEDVEPTVNPFLKSRTP